VQGRKRVGKVQEIFDQKLQEVVGVDAAAVVVVGAAEVEVEDRWA
jgi:hypothetical protein